VLEPIRILVTACGYPVASTLLKTMHQNGERHVILIEDLIVPHLAVKVALGELDWKGVRAHQKQGTCVRYMDRLFYGGDAAPCHSEPSH
jgi:hypothetical protein